MKIIKENTALAAVSELRTRMDEILAQLRETPVILEKHRREVAVLVEPKRYKAMQETIEAALDILLAIEERRRGAASKARDSAVLEQVEKRLKSAARPLLRRNPPQGRL